MSLTQSPSSVSLQDSGADATELEILRTWMMRDEDEFPAIDDHAPSDELWWSQQGTSCLESESPADRALKLLDFRHVTPQISVALVENEHWTGPDYPYFVLRYRPDGLVAVQGSDTLDTARWLFDHWTTPLPDTSRFPGEAVSQ